MAVVTMKSAAITNRDALPPVLNNGRDGGGHVKTMAGVVTVANGDSIGSKLIAGSIPSNARVLSVKLSCADIGTTGTTDIGLYRTTKDGGAVVDADYFGSAVSISGGALARVEQIFESGVVTFANFMQQVWQRVVAFTTDPGVDLDVVLTLTAASDAAGTILVEVDYVV